MDTNSESHRNNNFIYALGLVCFLNILSSEIFDKTSTKIHNPEPVCMVSDFIQPTYFLI